MMYNVDTIRYYMTMNSILMITGPTAIGKTTYAINHAIQYGMEIISADSMQVYRYMDIGTAKPSHEELRKAHHHLIDIIEPDTPFSVADYLERFKEVAKQLDSQNKQYLVVGGTGLYLRALMEGFSMPDVQPDTALRAQLQRDAEKHGGNWLHDKLQGLDKYAAERLHPNDHFRIIRALEVVIKTGKPLAAQQKKGDPVLKNVRMQCLTADRQVIYDRIEKRVDDMFERGLIEEVQNLLAKGYNKRLTSLQALGYKETIEHLDGKYTKRELIDLVKKKTRNFAKRQMTWFRSFRNVEWIPIQ